MEIVRKNTDGKVQTYLSLLAPTTRLLLISLLCLWGTRTCQKLITVFLFSYSSVTDFKQRKPINYFLLGKCKYLVVKKTFQVTSDDAPFFVGKPNTQKQHKKEV